MSLCSIPKRHVNFVCVCFVCLFVDILKQDDMLKHFISVEHLLSIHVEVITVKVMFAHHRHGATLGRAAWITVLIADTPCKVFGPLMLSI